MPLAPNLGDNCSSKPRQRSSSKKTNIRRVIYTPALLHNNVCHILTNFPTVDQVLSSKIWIWAKKLVTINTH